MGRSCLTSRVARVPWGAVATTVCGICGGSGAGKTTLGRHLVDRIGPDRVSILAFDAYYHDLSHLVPAERARRNYDHPDALDHELFVEHLAALRLGRDVEIPVYDFATHTRTGDTRTVRARPVLLVEGILLFAFDAIRPLLDHAVFLDIPASVRLERRIRRDVAERGRDPDDVRRQFTETVAPMHDLYVQPFRHLATRIVGVDEALDRVADELAETLGGRRATV